MIPRTKTTPIWRAVLVASLLGGAALMSLSPIALAQTVGKNPVRGGTLNIAIAPEPTQLTSANLTTMNVGMASSKILEGLVSYDLNLQPVPALATSWEVAPDGKIITFHLRKGVKWHDGKDFTAADVEWTLKEVWQKLHPFGRAAFANVQTVETPDAHTIILRLSAPAPYILNYINTYGAQILPKHIYESTDVLKNPANQQPVGTGPFVFKEWVKGSHIRLKRNENYWGKDKDGSQQPYLDELLITFIPDAAARTVALETGEIDVALGSIIPLTNLNRFKDDNKFSLNQTDGNYLATISILQFNLRKPYFQDVRLRQAFAHAIDKEALLRLVFQGYGKVATGPVPSSVVNYYSDDVKKYPYDPKRAEQLLDEAGFKKGADGQRLKVTLELDSFSGAINPRSAEYYKQALGKVGVEVVISASDTATYLKRIFTDADYDLMLTNLHRLPDPTLGVQRLYWTKNIRPGVPWTNGTGYSNPRLDKVMEDAAVEANDAKRKALIKEWQQIVQEDLPILEVIEPTWVTVSTARFKKLVLQGDGLFASYADAWLESKPGVSK